jgi:hypothetical protein
MVPEPLPEHEEQRDEQHRESATVGQYAAAPPCSPKRNGPARYVASRKARIVNDPSTRRYRPRGHQRLTITARIASKATKTTTTVIATRPGCRGTTVGVVIDDRLHAPFSDPPAAPVSIVRPSIASGRSIASRCRIVGHVSDGDEAVVVGRRRREQARLDTGRSQRRDGEAMIAVRRLGPDDQHRVMRRADVGEECADQSVGVARAPSCAACSSEADFAASDARTRSIPPRAPRTGRSTRRGNDRRPPLVEAHPERAVASACRMS